MILTIYCKLQFKFINHATIHHLNSLITLHYVAMPLVFSNIIVVWNTWLGNIWRQLWQGGPQMFSHCIYPGLLLTGTSTLLSASPSRTLLVSAVTHQLDIVVYLCYYLALHALPGTFYSLKSWKVWQSGVSGRFCQSSEGWHPDFAKIRTNYQETNWNMLFLALR